MHIPLIKSNSTFYKDLAERAFSTFWQAAAGTLLMFEPTSNWGQLKQMGTAAGVAGIAAVWSMVKSYAVRRRGIQNSASSNAAV
jgi:hypothetical protein